MKTRIIIFFIISWILLIQCTKKNNRDLLRSAQKEQEFRNITLKKNVELSSSSVNYFNIDDYNQTEFQSAEDDSPLKVVDFGPTGELSSAVHRPSIYVVFSQPIVPLTKIGDPLKAADLLSITPPVKGTYRWYGTKLLSFEPDESLKPQQKYQISISQQIKSLGGKKLEGETGFSFVTELLKLVHYSPAQNDIPLPEAKYIQLTFNYPVNPQVIKDFIQVRHQNQEYSFKIKRPEKTELMEEKDLEKSVLLEMNRLFEPNSKVYIRIIAGAKSEADNAGIPGPIEKSFSTIKPFVFVRHRLHSYSFPKSEKGDSNPVYLTFSHPVDEKSVAGQIKVSLNVEQIDDMIEVWGNTIKLSNLPVEYDSKYWISLSKNIKDIYNRTLNGTQQIEIAVPNASRYAYFPNRGTKILEADFAPKIVYEYQNTFEGVWNIAAIDNPYPYPGNTIFQPSQLKAYDFSNLKKNVKHFEVLDLSAWLNQQKKGFVGIAWNFEKKRVPEQFDYQRFHDILLRIDNPDLRKKMQTWYYTNKQKQYYRLNYDYRYDQKVKDELKSIFKTYGIPLERPEWGQKNLQLQVTDLAITARVAYNKTIVLASYLSTGLPVKNGRVILFDHHSNKKLAETVTDNQGIAILKHYTQYPKIHLEKDTDKVQFVPNDTHNAYHFGIYSTVSPERVQKNNQETFIFTDRGLYKPGETVTYRGIDRNLKLGQYSVYQGKYQIKAQGTHYKALPFYTSEDVVTESGGFYGSFKLPDEIEPGYYELVYQRAGQKQKKYLTFRIAHFRRLNFQVKMKKPDFTYYSGDTLSVQVNADYLAGGALSGANCEYYWTRSIAYFNPRSKKWANYRFGPEDHYESRLTIAKGTGKLGTNGKITLKQKSEKQLAKGATYQYKVSAHVEDIDRQVIQASSSMIVHPASFYIGAKFKSRDPGWWSPFVKMGEKVGVDFVLVTPEEQKLSQLKENLVLKTRLYRKEWKVVQQKGVYNRINSRYQSIEKLEKETEINLSRPEGEFNIKTSACGQYILELECVDPAGKTALTRFRFYSTGSQWFAFGTEDVNDINLESDKTIYQPGEKVRLLVKSPLKKGRYLLTLEREGIIEEKVIQLEGSANVIEIPVLEDYLPVFYVALCSYSIRENEPAKSYFEPDLDKPKGYFGIIPIQVSTESREIKLEIMTEQDSFLPGTEAELTIQASRAGKPAVETEITFLAADRGVLDLINYHVPDPLDFFYDQYKFPLGVYGGDSRSLLIDPVTYEVKDLQGGDGKKKMKKRKDFRPTAVFEPYLKTDQKGRVKLKFKLPDTLTTYRCTAIAVKNNYFGIEEHEIKVQNPINVRTALPRRLRIRDTSFAGVIVTNLDQKTHEVSVQLSSDLLLIEGESEKSISIPAQSSVEIPFKIVALQEGEATLNFVTRSEVLSEELEVKLTIEKPIIKEAFTTIGETKASANQSTAKEGIIIPSHIAPGYGGLTISLDSSRVSNLSQSIQYLYNYPHQCLEQRSSRMLPLIVFEDHVQSILNIKEPRKIVEKELRFWAKYQNSDGGFPFWLEGLRPSNRFISIKVARLLYFARDKGYKIPAEINRKQLLKYISSLKKDTSQYLKLYSLYVQSLYGINIEAKAINYLKSEQELTPAALAFLGLTLNQLNNKTEARKCLARLKNLIKVGTQTIDLANQKHRYYFNSRLNELALLLMLYQQLDPGSHMIQKIVNTIMQEQKGGYWRNTVATDWIIQAFAQVIGKESGLKTDYKAVINLSQEILLEHSFVGISKKPLVQHFPFDKFPLKDLERKKLYPLHFTTEGKGILYYTATLKYSPPGEVVRARDEGFSIYTRIYDLSGQRIKENEKLKLGGTYKLKAIISTARQRNYVVARIPVPSGAEVLDSSFVTTAINPEDDSNHDNYDRYYYYNQDIQKIMDNEVNYFFDRFRPGKKEVEFIFRVTTPGIYPTPPAVVECMYEEEVFGRTQGKLYVILPE